MTPSEPQVPTATSLLVLLKENERRFIEQVEHIRAKVPFRRPPVPPTTENAE